MIITFISNYFTHHQKPLSDALAQLCDYTFVSAGVMTQERRNMGWGEHEDPGYVCSYVSAPEYALEKIAAADVVIAGNAPAWMVRDCLRRKQLVLRYSERPLKKGLEPLKFLPRLVKWHRQNPPWRKVYVLCSSAFTAEDYAKFGLFRGKCYRWGYFPAVKSYDDLGSVLNGKEKNTLLWVGRFLPWKHPDDAIMAASALKKQGVSFTLDLIGSGVMEDALRDLICREGLQDHVRLLGTMTPEEVRVHMERAGILLVTSDRQEGWGAVVNEAMNSGCAVVVSDAVGAAGYLIRHGENGWVYPSGDVDALQRQVKTLLEAPDTMTDAGEKACRTITELWNGEVAAQRLMTLAQAMLDGEKSPDLYPHGPCSRHIL
jgi:glycosyltransferase involved in cell wall biosynthesis